MIKDYLSRITHKDQLGQTIFTFRKIIKLLWKVNPKFTISILILSAVWGLLTFPAFYLEKLILDKLVANIGNPVWQQVLYSIVFLIVARVTIEVVRNGLSTILSFLREHSSKNFHIEIELMLADKLSRLDVATIEDAYFQDKFNKLEREAGRRAWGIMMPLTEMPNFITGFISAIGILWFLHPLVAVVVVAISFPQVLVDRKFIRKWYNFELEVAPKHRIRGHITHYLIRTKNYLEGRILELREHLIGKMRQVHYGIVGQELAIQKEQEVTGIWLYFPLALFYAGVNIYLVVQALTAKITIGSYELFLRSLLAASQNFASFTNSLMRVYENYVFVSDLIWFLNLKPKINLKGGRKLPAIEKSIEMNNVWFRYKEDGAWILKGITTKFAHGEKVAIVGENGAGKSTLIKVLTRFYDPTHGQVLVDDVDIKDINYSKFQGKFAVLFQNFEDYSFSARESIGFGDVTRLKDITGIKSAAKKTGIHTYIESLPLKYENPLSPHFFKGVQLSGGQWQRVGIARMLFRKSAQVLILDEPTSNVDPEAEEKIFNELLKISKNKILIFISQRFSTVRRADKIIVVDKGKIIEQGTHEELIKKNGKYKKMFELQAKRYR